MSQDLILLASSPIRHVTRSKWSPGTSINSKSGTQPSPVSAVVFGGKDKQAHGKRSWSIFNQTLSVAFESRSERSSRTSWYVFRRRSRVMDFSVTGRPERVLYRSPTHHYREIDHHHRLDLMVQLHQKTRCFEGDDSANAMPGQSNRDRSAAPPGSPAIGRRPSLRSRAESARLRLHGRLRR